jgi:hypothetical protein
MFEYVKDYGLNFKGGLINRKNTDLIVLHHSEGGASETVQSIHDYHLSEGHKGIDYNVCIQKDGTVVWGRGLDAEGGHTMNKAGLPTCGVNARSVGIVCLGNFMKEKMGDVQKEALKKIVSDVVRYYKFDSASQIVSHREIAGRGYTDCPGDNFPIEEVRAFIRAGGAPEENPYIYTAVKDTPLLAQIGVVKAGQKVQLDSYFDKDVLARIKIGGNTGQVIFQDLKR